MAKDPRAALTDMLDAVRRIERYTKDMSGADFGRDELKRDAVERCIEIVSEASRRLPEDLKNRHPEVPWNRVAAAGNIFRHEYDAVYPPLVWNIVSEHLPILKKAIGGMLRHGARRPTKKRGRVG